MKEYTGEIIECPYCKAEAHHFITDSTIAISFRKYSCKGGCGSIFGTKKVEVVESLTMIMHGDPRKMR